MTSVLEQLLAATAAGPVSAEQAGQALARGQKLLGEGRADEAAVALRVAALAATTQLEAHNLIEAHGLPGSFGAWMGLPARIDPQDDVFGYFNGYGSWSSPLRDYLADGWRTLSELMLLLERSGQPLVGFDSVLEFASGHGRFTRHLVKALGAGRVTVSDVVPGAVAFAREHFGVSGFVSQPDPARLAWPGRYGLVFVLSLLTHLPRASWGRWLARLWEAVAPGGVLVLTTHGALAAGQAGVPLDGDGFFFHPESESTAIDGAEYGTTYTSREFVMARVAELLPQPAALHVEPAWFWSRQDAWVLQRPLHEEAVA